jgi:adenylate cyclase
LGKLIPQREIAAAMPPNANARSALVLLDTTSVAQWLVERGLRGLPLDDQVDGFCRRVVDAGFPARRFNMSIGTLHPRHGARSYVWRPSGLETEEFPRQPSSAEREPYLRSPIHHLKTGEISLAADSTGAPDDFPVLATCARLA